MRSDFDIIPQSFPLVNTFFKSFFTFFDIFLRLFDAIAPEWATFDIIAPTLGFVNSFFEKNRLFSSFPFSHFPSIFFGFELDFCSSRVYNIGSEKLEKRDRYVRGIAQASQGLDRR